MSVPSIISKLYTAAQPVGATGGVATTPKETKGGRYRRMAKRVRRIYDDSIKAQNPEPVREFKLPRQIGDDDCEKKVFSAPGASLRQMAATTEMIEASIMLEEAAREFDFLEAFDPREMVTEFANRLIQYGMEHPVHRQGTQHGLCFISTDDVDWLRSCAHEFIEGRQLPPKSK